MEEQDVSTLLEEQQTGQYVPGEEEKKLQEELAQGPRKLVGTNVTRPQDFLQEVRDPSVRVYNVDYSREASEAGWGGSRFDVGTFEPGMDLENSRAIQQSSGSKILNGAVKGGIVAATTAVETVAGVIDGLLEGTVELGRQALSGEGVDMSTVVGRGVNNFTARTMADIQKLSEEWFPNYRTAVERSDKYQDEWYKHIFTANFIGDSFLKNFGFTVGAIGGGALWSKALSAGLKATQANKLLKGVVAAAEGNEETKAILQNAINLVKEGKIATIADDPAIAKIIGDSAKSLNKMSTMHQLFGGVIGAMGEGTFEGIMARNEFTEAALADAKQKYLEELRGLDEESFIEMAKGTSGVTAIPVVYPDGTTDVRYELNEKGLSRLQTMREAAARKYLETQQYINELGDRVAATTFLWNLPILTVSNTMQFGRMLSGGFNTTRNVAKTAGQIARREGKLVGEVVARNAGKGMTLAKGAMYAARNAGSEAAEEMSQGFVSSGAKHVADARLTSFNDDGFDRESLKGLGHWVGQMLDGGMEYLKDGRNWQEGFLGMMTGLVGIPGRRWNGGIPEAVRQAREEVEDSRKAADALNTLVNSERFQNAIKGYVRHQKYETEMADGIKADDKYTWKTASDKQLVNDIITFANAGRLQDLNDIVDYYASMPEDDSNGLNVVEAASGEHNAIDAQNNPEKIVRNVKERAKEIKDNIKMYNDMYDAMSTIAPIGTSRDQIEEMVAASMNIKAFEKRFLEMFDQVIKGIEPYVKKIAETDEKGNRLQTDDAKLQRARDVYTSIAEVFTNVEIPLNPDIIEQFEGIETISKLKDIVDSTGSDELKKLIGDIKKVAVDRKAFVNKLLTLKGLSSDEFEAVAENADKVNNELRSEEARKEAETLTSLKAVRDAFEADRKKNFGDSASFIVRMRDIKGENEHVAKFLDIYDAYADLRSSYIKQSGSITGIAQELIDKAFNDANEKADVLDDSKVQTYEQWQAANRNSITGGNIESILAKVNSRLDVDQAAYDAAAEKVKRAMRSVRDAEESAGERKQQRENPAPEPKPGQKPIVSGGEKEEADPATEGPDPTKKKTSTLAEDGQSAVDAAGRTWKIGETVFCYDSTKKKNVEPEEFHVVGFHHGKRKNEVFMELEGPRKMNVSLAYQVPFIHKEMPVVTTESQQQTRIPVSSPTKTVLLDDAVVDATNPQVEGATREQNTYGQKMYYQTAIPEFTAESARAFREAKTPEAKKTAIQKLVDFLTPERLKDKTIQKLVSENAWTNMVEHVEVGDKVQFIALPGYVRDGKPVIFMAVEKDGQRYIFNVMRRSGAESYAGLQDFLDAFDIAYQNSTERRDNREFVFPKQSTVWAKRDGIIDYVYSEDYSGERPIVRQYDGKMQPGIDGYDENAPIVWINGNAEFETLRGDPAAVRSVNSWMNMTQRERNGKRGSLYYLANDGNGGYIPIRLGLEHFTPENMDTDTPDFAAIRRSLTNIQGIAGAFFNRVKQATTDEERNAIMEEENKRLHEEVGNGLKKYLNLSHGFFRLMFSKEGAPILMYDANPAIVSKRDSDKFEGFILGENNYDMLLGKFAEERVSFDLRPKENLNEFLRKGYITSNAKKLLPKQTDVYIERFEDGDFVSTETQKAMIPQDKSSDIEDEVKPIISDEQPLPAEDGPLFDVPVDEAALAGGGFEFVNDFEGDELGGFEQAPEPTPEKTPWQQLTKAQQDALVAHYGEEIREYFDDPTTSPEDRQDKLDCVGVN